MAYYKICPECGCALDPGERCDCEDKKRVAHDDANITGNKGKCEYSDNLFYHRNNALVNLLEMEKKEQRASIANMSTEELRAALKEAILSLPTDRQLQIKPVLESITAKKQLA